MDDQFQYAGGYASPITSASATAATTLTANPVPVAAPKNGFVYIFVSNESNYNVYFDNLLINYQQGPILEDNAYYPFGLTMAGISDKAIKPNYAQNKYRYNGKELQNQEFSDGTGLEEYDYGARQYDQQIGRLNQIDPSASKFVGISPFSYTANNPILLNDPTGKDWSITLNQNKDGSWTLNINFKGQVLNSSNNKSLNTKALAGAIKKQFESVFNTTITKDKEGPAINVVATADVTTISSKDQLAKDATLFEVRNSDDDNFKTDNPNVTVLGMAIDGKDILLNEAAVNDFTGNSNTKTLPHEIGHTGGLRHPATDPSGLPVVPYIHNPSNFMNQGTQFLAPFSNSNFTGVTREQVLRIFNLYSNGYLNQKEGIHPIDRNDLPVPF